VEFNFRCRSFFISSATFFSGHIPNMLASISEKTINPIMLLIPLIHK
jgi:hypothetical protein